MREIKIILTVLLGLISFLPGCLKAPKYAEKKLINIAKNSADFEQTKENVTVRVKKFSRQDCAKIFGENGRYFFNGKTAIYPIQITINNHSSIPYELSKQHIDLKLTDHQPVAQKLKLSPVGRCLGYTALGCTSAIGAIITAPIFLITTAFGFLPVAIPSGIMCIGSTIAALSSPAIGICQAVDSCSINETIEEDLEHKTLDSIIIEPRTTISNLIFVRKKFYKDQFTITLVPDDLQHNEKLIFEINLRS